MSCLHIFSRLRYHFFIFTAALQRRSGSTKKGRKSGILATLFQAEVGHLHHLGDSYNSHRADRVTGRRREDEERVVNSWCCRRQMLRRSICRFTLALFLLQLRTHTYPLLMAVGNPTWRKKKEQGVSLRKDEGEEVMRGKLAVFCGLTFELVT